MANVTDNGKSDAEVRELSDAELELVAGGFNPQPDPPGAHGGE